MLLLPCGKLWVSPEVEEAVETNKICSFRGRWPVAGADQN